MHILIAPNAFKNSLTAPEVAKAVENGIQQSGLDCTTECFPIADGGDGTAALIIQNRQGKYVSLHVHDPLGRMIETSFGLIDGGETAVIEMADASGLRLLKQSELDPMHATSFGTGEMIKKAMELGVKKILIAMGGSATVDCGAGILAALGAKFLDKDGRELANLPRTLFELEKIDLVNIDDLRRRCEIVVLCDVDNQLLGKDGAAAVFGPQKGADPEMVRLLEAGSLKFSEVTKRQTGLDISVVQYSGAAGGASAAVYAWLNAKLKNGIDCFLELTRFQESLLNADILITGEGCIDEQTLHGKGPFGVAAKAKKRNIPVIGLAGRVPLTGNWELNRYFDVLMAIGNQPTDLNTAMNTTEENVTRVSKNIGHLLQVGERLRAE